MKFSSLTQFRNGLLGVSFDIDFQELVRVGKKKGKKTSHSQRLCLGQRSEDWGHRAFGVIIASGRILHLDCRGLSNTEMGTRA